MQLTEQQEKEGWRIVKFGTIANNVSKRVDPSDTNLKVYVGLEHLDSDNLQITRRGIPADVKGQKLLVKPGQIIFGKRRAYQRKVAVANFEGICSAHAMVLEAITEAVIPEYLPFFMQSDMFMERAVAISEGSLSPTIKWKTLANQMFPLPPRNRQKEMLNVLSSCKNCIDLRTESSLASQNLSSVLLDSFLADFHKNKNYIHLGDVCKKITDGSHQKVDRDPKGEIPFLYVSCIGQGNIIWENTDRINDAVYEAISKGREVEKGDLLYSAVGSYGNAVAFDKSLKIGFQRHVAIIKPDNELCNYKFLEIWINSKYGRFYSDKLATGNAQKSVTLKDLKKFPFPNIDINKQNQIVFALSYAFETEKVMYDGLLRSKGMFRGIINSFLKS